VNSFDNIILKYCRRPIKAETSLKTLAISYEYMFLYNEIMSPSHEYDICRLL